MNDGWNCGANLLLRSIDMRLLQLVGIVHVHRLPLGIELDCADAALAMTIARGLHSAKWKVYFRADGRSIDVRNAGIQVAHSCECLVDILRIDRRRQAIFD